MNRQGHYAKEEVRSALSWETAHIHILTYTHTHTQHAHNTHTTTQHTHNTHNTHTHTTHTHIHIHTHTHTQHTQHTASYCYFLQVFYTLTVLPQRHTSPLTYFTHRLYDLVSTLTTDSTLLWDCILMYIHTMVAADP